MPIIERFVPVILAADGSITEAADHLVATRPVRKPEDRFGVQPDDLDVLADSIETLWHLDGEKPSKTTDRIRAEALCGPGTIARRALARQAG
jgi:hypothetical protein